MDITALRRAGGEIGRAAVELRSTLDHLESDARPLVRTWDGAAQRAYTRRQEAWRRAADDLTDLLRRIGVAVDDSAEDYLATEARNRALFE